jgi:hypothetical protein
VCLLLTRNHAFAKFMTQLIGLKANFPEHRIQSIQLDNAAEFSSRAFNDYCMAKEFKCNIQYHMYIAKMVWLNLS